MNGKIFLTASVGILVGAGVSSYLFTQSLAKEYKDLILTTKKQTQEVQTEDTNTQKTNTEAQKTETASNQNTNASETKVENSAPTVDNTPKVETVEVQQLVTNPASSNIGEQKAREIMLGKVPGGSFKSFHYDGEDNTYEGEIIKGNYEYDIEVSARTGKIIKCEKEFLERFDD